MSDLKHLLEFKNGRFHSEMFASPSVCNAYKVLLEGDHVAAEQRFRRILRDDSMDHEAIAGLAVCVAEATASANATMSVTPALALALAKEQRGATRTPIQIFLK